jgi:hypothetical protein
MQFKVKGILSFPHLFQARSVNPGDDPKFSCTILIRKDDPQLVNIQAIVAQEKAAGFPNGFPAKGKCFLKDGAAEYPNDPKMHNYMIISGGAKVEYKPAVVDSNMQPVMDPSQVVSGDIAWASFNTFVYKQAVNSGVSAGLNAVMITGVLGELGRLDSRKSVEELFSDMGSVVPAPAPAPSGPIMTAAAQYTYAQYVAAGWTDQQMIAGGLLVPPTSF